MRPTYHTIISVALSAILFVYIKSWAAVIGCLLSGIFIDIDHFLDYYMVEKHIPLRYSKLVDFCSWNLTGRNLLVFHSYELIILLWLLIYSFNLGKIWLGIAIGASFHLICDQIVNPFKPFVYFASYRIRNKFLRTKLFTDKRLKAMYDHAEQEKISS